jgi:2-oxoglutarate ferredoxin oxidoreductase subunit gamma
MNEILIAGFGGQGILFAGKLLAYSGMLLEKNVSWLPSYGPEMRGGTANCNVILSDEPIGAPTINAPNVLIVMNRPSLDKFENIIQKNGLCLVDSSLIDRKVEREDIREIRIPATAIAHEMNAPKLANMVMLGKFLKESGLVSLDTLFEAMQKVIPPKKADLFALNQKVVMAGYDYSA